MRSGNVWVTAPGGLWVYAPDGRHIGKVAIPELAANLHWGGEDWRTLFVCATHSVYTIQTKVGPAQRTLHVGLGTADSGYGCAGACGDAGPTQATNVRASDQPQVNRPARLLSLESQWARPP